MNHPSVSSEEDQPTTISSPTASSSPGPLGATQIAPPSNVPHPSPSTCLAHGCKKSARKFRTLCNAHQKQREKKGFIQLYNGEFSYVHHKQHHRQLIQEHRQNQNPTPTDATAIPTGEQPKRNKRGRPRKYPLPNSDNNNNDHHQLIEGESSSGPVLAIKTRPTRTARRNTKYSYDSDELDFDNFDDDDEEESQDDVSQIDDDYGQETDNDDNDSSLEDPADDHNEDYSRDSFEEPSGHDDPHFNFARVLQQSTRQLETYRRRRLVRSASTPSYHNKEYSEEDEVGLLSYLFNSTTTSPIIPSLQSRSKQQVSSQQLRKHLQQIPDFARFHLGEDGTLRKRKVDQQPDHQIIHEADDSTPDDSRLKRAKRVEPKPVGPTSATAVDTSAVAEFLASMDQRPSQANKANKESGDDSDNSVTNRSQQSSSSEVSPTAKSFPHDHPDGDLQMNAAASPKVFAQATGSEPTPILSM